MEIALGILLAIVLLPLLWKLVIFLLFGHIFLPILAFGWCVVTGEKFLKWLRSRPLL